MLISQLFRHGTRYFIISSGCKISCAFRQPEEAEMVLIKVRTSVSVIFRQRDNENNTLK